MLLLQLNTVDFADVSDSLALCFCRLFMLLLFGRVDVETGGLISKVLLANADALCAAVSPLMDVEEDPG